MQDPIYSVNSVASQLTESLHQYLEAQYHIWNEPLLYERKRLLDTPGVTFQKPALEATPFYQLGRPYVELAIPEHARRVLKETASLGIGVFPTPFEHQSEALEKFFAGNEIVVATGTGSGKTECFLLPILSQIVVESHSRPDIAGMPGCRALLLYPMNALVNDQLGRLRRLFGDYRLVKLLAGVRARPIRFGMYTSRTPYPGRFSEAKNKERLAPLFEKLFRNVDAHLRDALIREGKWPAKDMAQFEANHYKTGLDDSELYTRHEIQGACPDILVTNHSMLEYMLLRPIESNIFLQTADWLHSNSENQLIIVLDEAHMYRGAAGAEVAMLLRRLQARLRVDRSKLRYILTSASLGKSASAITALEKFASDLTGLQDSERKISLITGSYESINSESEPIPQHVAALATFDMKRFQDYASDFEGAVGAYTDLCKKIDRRIGNIDNELAFRNSVFELLKDLPHARLLSKYITGEPRSLDDTVTAVFGEDSDGVNAIESLLALAAFGRRSIDERVFLPVRLHLFFRGLSGVYACVNSNCTGRLHGKGRAYLGRLFDGPQMHCDCGSRVYELLTHRDCGAAFLRGYLRSDSGTFLWHEPSRLSSTATLIEAHFLAETDRDRLQHASLVWLHKKTGRINRNRPNRIEEFVELLQPGFSVGKDGRGIVSFGNECPVCRRTWRGETKIMDLATKGEPPFAHLVKMQVKLQPAVKAKSERFPNAGRKSLLFSDGRQRAARLARDIPREVERDVFRQLLIASCAELKTVGREARLDPAILYTAFVSLLARHNISLLDGADNERLKQHVRNYKSEEFADLREALEHPFSKNPPSQFSAHLLRQLGSTFYSISALTLAYLTPTDRTFKQLCTALPRRSEADIRTLTIVWITEFLERYAFDPELPAGVRANAAGYPAASWGLQSGFNRRFRDLAQPVFGDLADMDQALLDRMAAQRNGSYFLLPDKAQVCLAFQSAWKQCDACTYISPISLRGLCANCGSSTVNDVQPETSQYLRARKSFWRDPVVRIVNGTQEPFNIDVEEHTAQLSYRDHGDPSSTTEEFERRFRDILVHQADTPIDVLSSTTTMEVGIDIGSLVAVAMRNVPPMRQNYQQRAGRAGRRGSAISTVITYAQNNPHDFHYFEVPTRIIAGDPALPVVDVTNPRIVERHIHAVLLQSFFQSRAIALSATSNIFSVLGNTWDFYNEENEFSLRDFAAWINGAEAAEAIDHISTWLPHQTKVNTRLVAQRFIGKLNEVRPNSESELDAQFRYLIEFLFAQGLLPSYAFPKDLCALEIQRMFNDPLQRRRRVETIERPQQGLNVALSEYAPGRLVVVNKKTYRIGSVAAAGSHSVVDRAARLFAEARRFRHCSDCFYIEPESELASAAVACPVCRGTRYKQIESIQPQIVYPEGRNELDELDDEQVFSYVTSAQLPVVQRDDEIGWHTISHTCRMVSAENQQLVMLNKGEDDASGGSGFLVCELCGRATLPSSPESTPHARNYYIEAIPRTAVAPELCRGTFKPVYMGYVFVSDVLLLRVNLRAPLNPSLSEPLARRPLEDALMSLADAMVLAACHRLDIDVRELNAGYRFVKIGGDTYADIFIYDTLSGGAGYAHMAAREFENVMKDAEDLLRRCSCQSSCDKCLRHYGNRRYHVDLDRFLASDLMRYLATGQTPSVDSKDGQARQLRALSEMLALEGWNISGTSKYPLQISLNDQVCTVAVYPDLVDPVAARHPFLGATVLLSAYELKKDLPSAFAKVRA
jgi:ATP-dependent helicase YprA (DUF1998 family)